MCDITTPGQLLLAARYRGGGGGVEPHLCVLGNPPPHSQAPVRMDWGPALHSIHTGAETTACEGWVLREISHGTNAGLEYLRVKCSRL